MAFSLLGLLAEEFCRGVRGMEKELKAVEKEDHSNRQVLEAFSKPIWQTRFVDQEFLALAESFRQIL